MTSLRSKSRRAWLVWALGSEAVVLLLAVVGPGSRVSAGRDDDHASIARLVIDEPGFIETVLINAAVLHVVIAAALLAAWIVTRVKRRRKGQ